MVRFLGNSHIGTEELKKAMGTQEGGWLSFITSSGTYRDDAFERDLILRTLAEQQGNMSRTADVLGVERSNLYRKMKAFGIAPARRADEEAESV